MDFLRDAKNLIRSISGPMFYGQKSYAQEGEDLALMRLIDDGKPGFYIEVGCHHPFRFSNTYAFYKRGWRGICIDPLPGTAAKFAKWRPRDIAVECAVAEKESILTYHMYNEPALNTFDYDLTLSRRSTSPQYDVIEKRSVAVRPLRAILSDLRDLIPNQISFFSVDVEGLDLEVLQSNDWDQFRPSAIVAESLSTEMRRFEDDPVAVLLAGLRYRPVCKTGNSVIYIAE